jgi:outer membrane autotransporter protein
VTNAVFDRLANWTTGLYQHKNGPYAEVLGQLASFDRDGARPGIDVDVGGVRGGFDKQFGDSVFGGSATILSGRANSSGLRSDVMTLRGDVYGTMTAGPFYFSADAGAASVWLENIERATGFGPLVAEGKTTNFVVSTTGEAGLVQRFGDVLLMPSARLTYFHSQLDGYDEQAPILALSYADRTTDALLGSVRLRAVVEANLFGSMPSSVFGEVGYEDYLSISNDQITASLVNNTALPTTVNPGDPNGPGFLGKVGISNQVSDHVFLDLNYGISVHNSGGETHSGDVRLKATF